MIIFGIDPGLLNTGFGVINADNNNLHYIDSGTFSTKSSEGMGERLLFLYDNLLAKMQEHNAEAVAVEQVFMARNPEVALKLGHARGVALLAAAHAGAEIHEFSSTAIKKSVVGFGRAEKGQIGTMVKMLLPLSQADSEHAADALATAIACAHHL